ncbi:maleylpyruvate isomerase family mycothiol-dependent enzyme [Actinokineospora diospyrosa]|uniref:TIGR03083 family protein n=1 Tax=Actinokineospora diospyrosa TaxID=103728 RepID=A0ABT1IEK4_9PSEU|nr:maleylpyruvate isomerase family mycothiol-dependent enzyme [Actinokineospora diospyrosa]MCP2271076.1 TIGR03083 family protein [Actinokineospora diospyrosa]
MPTVSKATLLSWTAAERLSLADLLEDLSEAEWRTRSLCPAWTMHDLAAHLTLSTRTSLSGFLKGILRARGNFDRMEADAARARAARFTPAELIAQLRETAHSPRRSPLSAPQDPLVDALVHGQDIARPLGRPRAMPGPQAETALARVLSSPFYGARHRLNGATLTATDRDWTSTPNPPPGTEIRGPISDLLLLATGRPAGLAALSGPGRTRLRLSK